MSVKLFDVTLTAATVQGLTASHYYWIDRYGNTTDAGGSALTATALTAAQAPTDQAILECSMFQAIEMIAQHGALTNAVGGKVSFAELMYDYGGAAAAPISTAPQVVGATIDGSLAATAECVKTAIVNAPTAGRVARGAVAILWTTVPTGGTGLRIVVIGHRDGQERARG